MSFGIGEPPRGRGNQDFASGVLQMVRRKGSTSPDDSLSCLRSFTASLREPEDWPNRRRYESSTSR